LVASLGYASRPSDTKKKEEEEEFESKRLQIYCTVIESIYLNRLQSLNSGLDSNEFLSKSRRAHISS
jgi:hypothetical protein